MGILTSFTGKGYIFCLGGSAAEEVVLSYNDSSAIHFQYDNYGLVVDDLNSFSDINIGYIQNESIGTFSELTTTSDLIIDYGLVSELRSETNDFGSITRTNSQNNSTYGFVSVNQKSSAILFDGKNRLVSAQERSTFTAKTTGTITVENSALTIFESGVIGEGLARIFGSTNESVVPSPYISSGSLFSFVSHTESSSYSPEGIKTLFNISGSASNVRYIPEHTGSGALFTFVSHTESSSYSPDDTKTLFSIGGSAQESTATERTGSGLLDVNGTAQESTATERTGSGALFTFVSHTESSSYSPDDTKVLFSIIGSASNVRYIPEHTGSGALFTFSSTTESSSYSPDDTKTLFSIGGSAQESTATERTGSGFAFIYHKSIVTPFDGKERLVGAYESVTNFKSGKTNLKFSGSASGVRYAPEHTGSGSLFTFSSTTESSSYSPDDTKTLFSIGGSAQESIVKAPYDGYNFISVSGKSSESITPAAHVAETSFVNIDGDALDSLSLAPYIGFGSLFTLISSRTVTAFSPKGTELFNIIGKSDVNFTSDYSGSGRLYGFTGSTSSIFYDYSVSQKAFKIFGSTFESFIKSNYNGSTFTHFSGYSQDEKIDFVPSKKTRLLII